MYQLHHREPCRASKLWWLLSDPIYCLQISVTCYESYHQDGRPLPLTVTVTTPHIYSHATNFATKMCVLMIVGAATSALTRYNRGRPFQTATVQAAGNTLCTIGRLSIMMIKYGHRETAAWSHTIIITRPVSYLNLQGHHSSTGRSIYISTEPSSEYTL